MKLIPHHQDDKHGTREYRSPDGAWRVVQTRRPRRKPERAGALGGSRVLRGPRRRLASSRRLRAPAGRAGLPGHHGRSVGGRERHDSARQAARDPRTLAGATPVQPAPDAEGADHARPRRNPLPGQSRGRCAACSCTIRGRSRRRASRRPAGSASGSGRRPATGNARQR